jgi:hypothetical protein
MREIMALNSFGRELVQGEFLVSDTSSVEFTEAHFAPAGATFDYDWVRRILVDATARFADYTQVSDMDVEVAPQLHQALRINRALAARTEIWHDLSCVLFSDFVRHRWGKAGTGAVSRERFLGSLKRNALARLWWGAELTVRDGGDYSATKVLFAPSGGQDLFEQFFGRRFSNQQQAALLFIDLVGSKPRRVVRTVSESFSQMLTTVVLESLSTVELRPVLESLIARAESGD